MEPGKKADVILLDLKVPHMTPVLVKPVRNVAPNIVYSARGDEITDVIINGGMVVEERAVTTMDEEKVIEDAQRAAEEIANNAVDDFMAADGVLAKAVRKGLI